MIEFNKIRYKKPRTASQQIVEIFIHELDLSVKHKVKFLQIGGNDGEMGDPIYKFSSQGFWQGHVVEPVPVYFKQLEKNYKCNPNVICINAAVSDHIGELSIFHLDPILEKKYPVWLKGCASTNRQRMANHLTSLGATNDIIERYLIEFKAPIIPIRNIIKAHNIKELDMLIIDVEGHEINVLNSFDFSDFKQKPQLCHIEVNGSDVVNEPEVVAKLSSAGYSVFRAFDNLIAVSDEARFVRDNFWMKFMNSSKGRFRFDIL